MSSEHITIATDAVLKHSSKSFCDKLQSVKGYVTGEHKFNIDHVISTYSRTGFQATQLAKAADIVDKMLEVRASSFEPDLTIEDEFIRPRKACSIFLAACNMASEGIRKYIRLMVKYSLVDCLVTTELGLEEDLIKSFGMDATNDQQLVDFLAPILDEMSVERKKWLPSELVERIGLAANSKKSICYWAAKNRIPIFCPSRTPNTPLRRAIQQQKLKTPEFMLSSKRDIRRINTFAQNTASLKTGVIVLGGGVPKHHTMNANLMRNGTDYAVYINTSPEFDGSDSGANPDEAISWGKIQPGAWVVKVVDNEEEAFPRLFHHTFLNHLRFDLESDRPKLDLSAHSTVAKDIINEMLARRLTESDIDRFCHSSTDAIMDIPDANNHRPKTACSIFLAYTSNMASSGLRDTIRSLVENNMVDCIVATVGGIEEDLIKSLELRPGQYANTYVGDLSRRPGASLRENGINRIGNLFVPNDNYCRFEDWLIPILNKMSEEKEDWAPSELFKRLGSELNHPESICYWAAKNNIPMFCPASTDGSLGDMLYFHSFRSLGPDLDYDLDLDRIETLAKNTRSSAIGVISLGGGAAEEYLMNAMSMRGGPDYCIFINTASEFGGGAKLDRYISQRKLRPNTKWVELTRCATLVFPELVAQTLFNSHQMASSKDMSV